MKSVIMAGGEGKRLRPITCTLPKSMVPLLNKPVIDYCIELLHSYGIVDITATLHYLPEVIKKHCGGGEKYGVKLNYSREDIPLGTAGSVKKAVGNTDERVLVISGDTMTDVDIAEAVRFHESRSAKVTIILKRVNVPTEYGVILARGDGEIYRFVEKPALSQVFSDLANTGIYIIEPEIIDMIPVNSRCDFSNDLFPRLLGEQLPIYGYVTEKYWCDIGDISRYKAVQRDMLDKKCDFATDAVVKNGVWVEAGAKVSESAIFTSPCYIGKGAEIGENVRIGEYAVIGSGVRIGANSSIKRSVLMQGARVRENAQLRGAVICENAEIQRNAALYNDAVAGSGSNIGESCTVSRKAAIWPQISLGSHENCVDSIKWQVAECNSLKSKICGYADGELTPERMLRIGAAYGASLGSLPREIAVATDGSQQGVMLKYALLSGVLSQGVDVSDMGYCSASAFRLGIRQYGCCGGAYIRHLNQAHRVELTLCDRFGADVNSNSFRALWQELRFGEMRPVTGERLGIIQRLNGIERAYDVYLGKLLTGTKDARQKVSLAVAGDTGIYDTVARTLIPAGFEVKFLSGDTSKLNVAMEKDEAVLGFAAEDGKIIKAVFKGEEIKEHDLTAILALDSVRFGRINRLVLSCAVPEEYRRMLEENGAEVKLTIEDSGIAMSEAMTSGSYLPELFEPEARIVRTAEICSRGRLENYLKELPKVSVNERQINLSWKDVGRVLRSLVETQEEKDVQLIDGVKVNVDKGWILVNPNSSFTACRIITGSMDAEYSRELADVYSEKIKILRNENS